MAENVAMSSADMSLTYVSVYDLTDGCRLTSYVVGIHGDNVDELKEKAKADFPENSIIAIQQTAKEWSEAISGDLRYDPDTQTMVNPPEPTEEEILEQKLNALDAEYESRFSEIDNQIAVAAALGNDDLKSELLAEREELANEYTEKREAL